MIVQGWNNPMSAQRFGGQWSLVKIDAVAAYLKAFNTALKLQPFERIYIDAFAGSGDFAYPSTGAGPLFDEAEALRTHAGSARRALETEPSFHRLTFIERGARNVASLRLLVATDPHRRRATVVEGDANAEVVRVCRQTDWIKTRGVIFLDPFGNSVEWSTLEEVARTKLDVWYLFPLSGVYRNAPLDQAALTADKRAAVARIVGAENWEEHFYGPSPQRDATLFDVPAAAPKRTLDVDGIEAFVIKRLRSIFPLVERPLRLLGPSRAPIFSLFFAMANKSKKAQERARPIAAHILRSR
jgi:three-Cys-motif partner protein